MNQLLHATELIERLLWMKSLLRLWYLLPVDFPEDQLWFLTQGWGGFKFSKPLVDNGVLQVEGSCWGPGAASLVPSQVTGPEL